MQTVQISVKRRTSESRRLISDWWQDRGQDPSLQEAGTVKVCVTFQPFNRNRRGRGHVIAQHRHSGPATVRVFRDLLTFLPQYMRSAGNEIDYRVVLPSGIYA